jgi:hypothetical protein
MREIAGRGSGAAMTDIASMSAANYLRMSLPAHCHQHIDMALDGDANQVRQLIRKVTRANYNFEIADGNLSDVVRELWKAGVSGRALRIAVEVAWWNEHDIMLEDFGDSIVRVFQAAQFPTSHLPPRLTVWRGGAVSPRELAKGLSWTTNRDTACWFAYRFRTEHPPVVLCRTIWRKNVLAHITAHGEDEIIVSPAARAIIDNDQASWRVAADRRERRLHGKPFASPATSADVSATA